MPTHGGPNIITNGLVLSLDASDRNSYPGSGTTWSDLSGNNQNFTLYNSPTYSSNNGGELQFTGTNDYARLLNSSAIDLTAANCTIQFWFRTISNTIGLTYARLISFSDVTGTGSDTSSTQGTNRDYDNYLCIARNGELNNESLAFWYKVNPYAMGPNILVNTNNYFNVSVSWSTNGSQMTFRYYLNGQLTTTSTVTQSAYSVNASTITIGQNCAGALTNPLENSSCAFSIIKLYNRALSATEVLQNYNATKSRYGL